MLQPFYRYFLPGIFLFVSFASFSQTDSLKEEKKNKKLVYREARKAAVMSAVIPGLGQIYNKKYWKAPIIYAGLGGFGYLLVHNQQLLNYYGKNLKAENDDDPDTINETGYTSEQLVTLKTNYRKYRDLGVIGCTVVYALNIIDANVDAHLKTFDVSDDLSLRVRPYCNYAMFTSRSGNFQTGITLQLNFKNKK